MYASLKIERIAVNNTLLSIYKHIFNVLFKRIPCVVIHARSEGGDFAAVNKYITRVSKYVFLFLQ